MNQSLKAAVYGLAVADALGIPYEFLTRGSFKAIEMMGYGSHQQPAGTWSDDTSLVLATCDSIREKGKIDPVDMQQRFKKMALRGSLHARWSDF